MRPASLKFAGLSFQAQYIVVFMVNKKTILLVDDDPQFLFILKSICETQFKSSDGYEVLTAEGRVVAEQICRKHNGNLVVVTDKDMPDYNAGVEFVAAVRKSHKQTPFLMITGDEQFNKKVLPDDVNVLNKASFTNDIGVLIGFVKQGFPSLYEHNAIVTLQHK